MNRYYLVKEDGTKIENPKINGLTVEFLGNDSLVEISEGSVFENTKLSLASESKIIIKKTSFYGIRNTWIDASPGGIGRNLFIDEGAQFVRATFVMRDEDNLKITIGKNCMLAADVLFRASDGHQIYDLENLQVFNKSKEIRIEDNVWMGNSVRILKGSLIKQGSIIGLGAIVAKQFQEENVAIAGNPAQIVKRNVAWSKDYIWDYKDTYQQDESRAASIFAVKTDENHVLWRVSQESSYLVIMREGVGNQVEHLKFSLKENLKLGENYYLVLDFISNKSTAFTTFLSNDSGKMNRIPNFHVTENIRRKIVFPFVPTVEGLSTVALSASHFPENTILKIFDFRIEKMK
ncbi:acyltransferase [Lactococcus cremoris]|jgi:acetyltransferase-like isoleucine patch superfamily enzyme|uniref:2,3,4,5-tetrahydropyridine-2,6-dicarboxylate N-acetyltransferase, dapD n=2 Tax=Lactococcus lactis subsp. cremoris TaxID=1359 RepID=A0ABR5EFD1_LACLC|nr:acyltransferase [Lactococcus cremoris]MCI1840504.1 hypothetical protein [Lactococcus lactis]KEY63743.1 putative acetyltransferase [Lactococcus cremoris subsp. cremoris GE214]KKW71331.1 2,3,4,5-tetrahydropyridine-2,6-dicarboxylate N- acetyltransferase, dapD [Lactococcus cremoris]KZK09567.1 putative capsule O-acetyl transferase [Lactococcus cremoris]KZK36650.1 putative capsule O-acetyl transferase [Lactococcus cremoris]